MIEICAVNLWLIRHVPWHLAVRFKGNLAFISSTNESPINSLDLDRQNIDARILDWKASLITPYLKLKLIRWFCLRGDQG